MRVDDEANVIAPSVQSFIFSDIGLRDNNEDFAAELLDYHFYTLADGIGGNLAGEIASKEAVLHFCDAVDKYFRRKTASTIASAKTYIAETFVSANTWIRRLSRDHPDFHGMGTTLCCLLVLADKVILGHVGDSRIYLFREKLSRLTKDHVLKRNSRKRGLTRALGASKEIQPELVELDYREGDIYLLCTDGLHGALTDLQIESVLRKSSSLKEMTFNLVDSAKKEGGRDNITTLSVKIGNDEKDLPR